MSTYVNAQSNAATPTKDSFKDYEQRRACDLMISISTPTILLKAKFPLQSTKN